MARHSARRNKKKKVHQSGQRGAWNLDTIEKKNELFEKYYKRQNNIVPESEWDEFMESLRRELPHSFRFLGNYNQAEALRNIMSDRYLSQLTELVVDGQTIQPPSVIPWYPNNLAYQMKIPRHVIRKEMVLNSLHNFLVSESELGNISRQETVSMIPPLLLDVRPHHKVLDMCAAPGSKTAQLIEMLLSDENQPVPSGFVVANDVDNKRCYLLVHQSLKRLQNACCVVLNHDASCFPNIYVPDKNGDKEILKFDRILCDVPCSGDGTLRKNLDIWKGWSPSNAYSLHKLQSRIVKRGFELLAPGGMIVYSTCSLNPAENEAVIARILDEANGNLELVDVSDKLKGLKRINGLHFWRIMEKDGRFMDSFEEVPEKRQRHLCKSLFPPSQQKAADLCLERCMRILPHHQDTGGFFVALLRKKNHTASGCSDSTVSDLSTEQPHVKKSRFSGFKEDPFVFFKDYDSNWKQAKEHFSIRSDFPESQVLARSVESFQKRNLYLVNPGIKDIIKTNAEKIKIINAGLRIFGRVEQKYEHCRFRLAQEGLHVMLPYLNRRTIELSNEDMGLILTSQPYCLISSLSEHVQKDLAQLEEGSVAFYSTVNGMKLSVCAWRGKISVAPYVGKDTKIHILRLLGLDTSAIETEMISNRKKGLLRKVESNDSDVGVTPTQEETVDSTM